MISKKLKFTVHIVFNNLIHRERMRGSERFICYMFPFFRLHWLFRVSTSLFPSIYLSSKFPSSTSRQKRVQGILNETLRVHSLYSTPRTPMYSYTTYRYTDSNKFYLKVGSHTRRENCHRLKAEWKFILFISYLMFDWLSSWPYFKKNIFRIRLNHI